MPTGAIIRIILRYVAGILIAKGIIDVESGHLLATDPDVYEAVLTVAGLLLGVATEFFYVLARRWGWKT